MPSSQIIQTGSGARIEWKGKRVIELFRLSQKQRVKLAVEMVRSQVVKNISRPVTKLTGPRGGRVITDRSKSGEFPKADTTQLMKTIFGDVVENKGWIDGFVGTPLDYGLILEMHMNRSFLRRTLEEMRPTIKNILTKKITKF